MLPYNKDNIKTAKALRKNATIFEKKLWYEFLSSYPVRFQRQKAIGEYIADFYCAKAKLVVELDGSGHYYYQQKQNDAERTNQLNNMNLMVLRFSNADINNNFYGVCEVIDREVKARLEKSVKSK